MAEEIEWFVGVDPGGGLKIDEGWFEHSDGVAPHVEEARAAGPAQTQPATPVTPPVSLRKTPQSRPIYLAASPAGLLRNFGRLTISIDAATAESGRANLGAFGNHR